MRSFQHIILDFETKNTTLPLEYWALNFVQSQQHHILQNVNLYKKFNFYTTSINSFWTTQLNLKLNLTTISNNVIALSFIQNSNNLLSLPTWYTLININFLRKERLYTKLKYSRSPAYDSVSGGAAAILAGFLGFLVSEKFGMELVDSGDFYFLTMYIVFLSFSVRPLLTILHPNVSLYEIFTLKANYFYFSNILSLSIKYFIK